MRMNHLTRKQVLALKELYNNLDKALEFIENEDFEASLVEIENAFPDIDFTDTWV